MIHTSCHRLQCVMAAILCASFAEEALAQFDDDPVYGYSAEMIEEYAAGALRRCETDEWEDSQGLSRPHFGQTSGFIKPLAPLKPLPPLKPLAPLPPLAPISIAGEHRSGGLAHRSSVLSQRSSSLSQRSSVLPHRYEPECAPACEPVRETYCSSPAPEPPRCPPRSRYRDRDEQFATTVTIASPPPAPTPRPVQPVRQTAATPAVPPVVPAPSHSPTPSFDPAALIAWFVFGTPVVLLFFLAANSMTQSGESPVTVRAATAPQQNLRAVPAPPRPQAVPARVTPAPPTPIPSRPAPPPVIQPPVDPYAHLPAATADRLRELDRERDQAIAVLMASTLDEIGKQYAINEVRAEYQAKLTRAMQ